MAAAMVGRWGPRGVALAIVAAVMTAAALPSSSAAGVIAPQVKLKVAKHEGGPYKEFQAINIPDGDVKNLFWRVKNVSSKRLKEVHLSDSSTNYPLAWGVKWFQREKDITDDVHTSDGHTFGLKRGRSKTFRQRLKAPFKAGSFCDTARAGGPNASLDLATVSVNGAVCGL